MNTTDTPRTNAATFDSRNGIRSSEGTVVLASFARQLEKELNEANKTIEQLQRRNSLRDDADYNKDGI